MTMKKKKQGSEAIVTAVKETEKKVKAPKLYALMYFTSF